MKMTTDNVYIVKAKLHELASHMYVLATGLQNAAPPGPSPASVQYLLEGAAAIEQTSHSVEDVLKTSPSTPELREPKRDVHR